MTLAEQQRIIDSQMPDRGRVANALRELVAAFPGHVRVAIDIDTVDVSTYLDRKPSALRGPTTVKTEVRTSFPGAPEADWETVEWAFGGGGVFAVRVSVDEAVA